MDTITKMETSAIEEDDSQKKDSNKINTKTKLSVKRDPKVRMSYVVPEEIYPENIDL